jgi:Aspartyl protease
MQQKTKEIINPSIHNWVNNNRSLLKPYKGMWIAHNADAVVASAKTGTALIEIIQAQEIHNYTIAYVHPTWFVAPVRFLPIRFKTFKKHEWTPNYDIIVGDQQVEMLIDSGADMCLIPKWLGIVLGLTLSKGEVLQEAFGIGGSVKYTIRNLSYIIDNYTIENVPTAWVQNEDVEDLIIGREVIFDAFDIEFKQAEETIFFKKRANI